MRQSEELGELFAALSQAQGDMDDARKDSVNPHFKSRYSDLASVRGAIRKPFAKHGLSYMQPIRTNGRKVIIETIIAHKSGQFISETAEWTALNETPQAMASATTYGRRYGLQSITGLSSDDDDGNAATGPRNGNGAGHDVDTIDPGQITELQRLIAEYKADKPAFMKYCGVESLAEIPAREYATRLAALQTKAPKQ
jgi:hypothetical protein